MKIFKAKINYSWFKENIGMIVLIPTILGGIWQLAELLALGTPYIRFFSISQLVSDGLLVLSILSFCIFGVLLVARTEIFRFGRLLFINEESPENSGNTVNDEHFFIKDDKIDKHEKIFNYILFAVMLVAVFYWIYIGFFRQQLKYSVNWNKITPSGIISFFMYLGSAFIVLGSLVISILAIAEKKVNFRNKYIRRSGPLLVSLVLIPVFFFGGKSLRFFHNSFLMPDNLKNRDYIEQQIKTNNPRLEGWNIAYYNDKFVFVAIEDSSCKQLIEVLEFDAMFSPLTSH
ncbi:hypothetical protein [Chitinophaga filiformis]|uniref:Uncharacterized protein n=1 Tax=Chitinophaga filiformis TaxID=104663 RepID=A0A1G7MJL4_CHIFI|nr:hypothetical protein [Chitinophaga filiformis]SDF61903.1 hypothetical protein SAMN04488121_102460 [Chitinophaga filiformis]